MTKLDSLCASSKDAQMLELLQVFLSMFNIVLFCLNQTCGDSISNMIAIECALNYMNMSLLSVYNSYVDLIPKNTTIKVKDKNIFVANNDETRLLEPVGIVMF